MVVENNFSETFATDLEKFKVWLSENEYYLNDIVTGERIILEDNMIGFNEPSRNKLECYVKELVKYYSLVKDEEEVDDIKTMIKNFRENKPKKVKKVKKVIKNKKTKKENEKVEIESKNEIKDDIKDDIKNEVKDDIKSTLESSKDDKVDIKVEDSLDTEDVCYIDTLEFCTSDLEKVFGKPLKNGGEDDKHQYEWKILVNGEIIYSIYNWKDKHGEFKGYNENTWHIATIKRCIKDNSFGCECNLPIVKTFIKDKLKLENRLDLLEKKVNKTKIKKVSDYEIKSKDEIKKEVLTESSIMKLFNLSDIEPNVINIDDICY